jgi:hypothetical protein
MGWVGVMRNIIKAMIFLKETNEGLPLTVS